jgi:hypothetical protein
MKGPKPTFTSTVPIVTMTLARPKIQGSTSPTTKKNNRRRGIFKPPIAAGKGSGNLKFSIVPGEPENSIMIYRYNSTDPGIMMPEIGRKSVHQEGLALLEQYIRSLEM